MSVPSFFLESRVTPEPGFFPGGSVVCCKGPAVGVFGEMSTDLQSRRRPLEAEFSIGVYKVNIQDKTRQEQL